MKKLRDNPLLHGRVHSLTAALLACLIGHGTLSAGSFTWNGAGGDANFSNSANWGGSAPAPATVNDFTFAGSANLSPFPDAVSGTSTWFFSSITFAAATSPFNVGGYAPGMSGPTATNRLQTSATSSLIQNSASDQRISSTVLLTAGSTLTVSGSGGGALALDSLRFAIATTPTLRIERSVTLGTITSVGSGGQARVLLAAPATLTFAQADAGSLDVLEIASTSETGNVLQTSNAGGFSTTASLTSNRGITFGGSNALTFGGALTLTGNGNKTLTFENTGGTELSGSVIQLGASGGAASRAISFQVDGSNAAEISGGITGSASTGATSIEKIGSGTLILSGANTYNGGTVVNAGTLLVSHDNAVAGGNLTLGDGTGTDTLRVSGGTTLAVDDFALTSSARLAFDLTGAFDATQVVVGGDQTGSGTYTVDIFDGGGFTFGTYTLLTVDGAFAASNFVLGALPEGFAGSSLDWDDGLLLLTAIPEPSPVWMLFGVGLFALIFRGRFSSRAKQ